ncbi:MAG: response regulator [Thermodesulfobacteriota bacterium]|nr:response regulator [Thermodesulfobacteriota bacterium]
MKILAVDNEIVKLESLKRSLRIMGHELAEALSADEALKVLNANENGIYLVLIDYPMPGMNGLDLLKNIRKFHAFLPVVMMTAYLKDRLVGEALQNKCSSLVEKPFSLDQLIQTIEGVLEDHHYRQNFL